MTRPGSVSPGIVLSLSRIVSQLRQAEIENLDEAVIGDHHVLGFQVPVNDARGMSLGEPVGHLSGNREQLRDRETTGMKQPPQRLAVDQLHDDVRDGIDLSDLVDGHDVRVVQSGGGSRLPLEPLQASRIRRQPGRQDLDGDLALKPRVPGPVNLPHPAGAERAQQLVRAKPRTRGSGHRISGESYRRTAPNLPWND